MSMWGAPKTLCEEVAAADASVTAAAEVEALEKLAPEGRSGAVAAIDDDGETKGLTETELASTFGEAPASDAAAAAVVADTGAGTAGDGGFDEVVVAVEKGVPKADTAGAADEDHNLCVLAVSPNPPKAGKAAGCGACAGTAPQGEPLPKPLNPPPAGNTLPAGAGDAPGTRPAFL